MLKNIFDSPSKFIKVIFLPVLIGWFFISAFIFFSIKNSLPYIHAKSHLQKSQKIIDSFGRNLVFSIFPTGTIEEDENQGKAVFLIGISGDKKEGDVEITLIKKGQIWEVDNLNIYIPN